MVGEARRGEVVDVDLVVSTNGGEGKIIGETGGAGRRAGEIQEAR